jgi:hypothetical protein
MQLPLRTTILAVNLALVSIQVTGGCEALLLAALSLRASIRSMMLVGVFSMKLLIIAIPSHVIAV